MIVTILNLIAFILIVKLFIWVGKQDDGSVPFFLDE